MNSDLIFLDAVRLIVWGTREFKTKFVDWSVYLTLSHAFAIILISNQLWYCDALLVLSGAQY